ncbi:MAG TPA: hypothetical protein VGG42_07695 [Acidobacteriaceae bacterium]
MGKLHRLLLHAPPPNPRIESIASAPEDNLNAFIETDTLASVQRTLQDHITHLEQKIESLRTQLQNSGHSAEFKKGLRLNLEVAETSLALFRKAYDLERKIAN